MRQLISEQKLANLTVFKLFPVLFGLFILSACAQMNAVPVPMGISANDHEALAKYYEDLSKEAKVGLQENKKLLQEYEEHAYYFGRQGQDVQSHTAANIRAYEMALRESQTRADHHRKIALEAKSNSTHKAKASPERDFILKSAEKPVNNNL